MTVVASNPLSPSFLLSWCSVAAAPGKQAIKIHVFKLLGASVQSKKQEATGFPKDAQSNKQGATVYCTHAMVEQPCGPLFIGRKTDSEQETEGQMFSKNAHGVV